MKFALLDTVVLNRDVPEHGLRVGDLGAVVDVPTSNALVIEFVRPGGGTRALLTLEARDVRRLENSDVLSVRVG